MPNRVAIVTDITAYLPEECLKQYEISVTPLSVIWGEQVYLDGVDIQPAEFYKRLAVTHAHDETAALSLLDASRLRFDPIETFFCPLSPGTVALNYMSGIA